MDTLRNPTGPLPAGIYWRRRVVVLGVLLAVVVGVVWACTRSSDADQKPASAASSSSGLPTVPVETVSPTASESASPSTSGSAGSPTPSTDESGKSGEASPTPSTKNGKTICPADDLRVSVRTDQKYYAPGDEPKFTVIIVNLRKSTCYVDMGRESAALTVISGKDRIWSNADCTKRDDKNLRKFPSGDVYTSTVTWERQRSAKGCPGIDSKAKAGYYVVDAKVGKAEPEERTVFVLEEN